MKAFFRILGFCAFLCGLPFLAQAEILVFDSEPTTSHAIGYEPEPEMDSEKPIIVAVLSPMNLGGNLWVRKPVILPPSGNVIQENTPDDEEGLSSDVMGNTTPQEDVEPLAPAEPVIIEPESGEQDIRLLPSPIVNAVYAPPVITPLPPDETTLFEKPAVDPLKLGPGGLVSAAIVEPLMAWVERETGVSVPVLPQVIADHERFYGVLRRMNRNFEGRPESAYIPGIVFMDDQRWDPEDPFQLSLLVHELVHHAQRYMKGVYWPCPNAQETQAYTLQNKWLNQRGHGSFVNAAWIQRVASCSNYGTGTYLAQTAAF